MLGGLDAGPVFIGEEDRSGVMLRATHSNSHMTSSCFLHGVQNENTSDLKGIFAGDWRFVN